MRKEYAQVSAKTEQAKGKKGFAHPTEGYKAEVSHSKEGEMGK
jgi:hypothetical protein